MSEDHNSQHDRDHPRAHAHCGSQQYFSKYGSCVSCVQILEEACPVDTSMVSEYTEPLNLESVMLNFLEGLQGLFCCNEFEQKCESLSK